MLQQEKALELIRETAIKMWIVAASQIDKSRAYLINANDADFEEITSGERFLDAHELKLYYDCESFLALYNPVAIDLRFILSTLRISYDLERIGDLAQKVSIAAKSAIPIDQAIIEELGIHKMFEINKELMEISLESFQLKNPDIAKEILVKDKELNAINKVAIQKIDEIIKSNPELSIKVLNLLSVIRRLERMGDHIKSIAEEIIFHIEAQIVRHKKAQKDIDTI